MAGILQFLDFNQASTSRKLFAHKKHNDGLEAPRNSLEFPMEASQSYQIIHEDIPYSCQVKQPSSSKMSPCPNTAPMKKLIDDEMSNKTKAKNNTPSVVARLMGMDPLPSETTSLPFVESKNMMAKFELSKVSSNHHTSISSTSFQQNKREFVPFDTKLEASQSSTKDSRMTKPWPREHPQEELLQKFKKDFEAWQASKSQERSRILDVDNNRQSKENVIIAQENLAREKVARYMGAKKPSVDEISIDHLSMNISKFHVRQGSGYYHEAHIVKPLRSNMKDDQQFRSRRKTYSVEHLPLSKFEEKWDRTSSPTRIVVLRPTSESDEIEESWFGASRMTEKEDSMEDFLQEVRERLRQEIQGKVRSTSTARGNPTKISFNERPTDTKHVARHIVKQIRENVTRDLGTTLQRSESTRSNRSEIQFDGPDSPEFIKRDTRRILSERLKNVLKNEADIQNPLSRKRQSGTTLAMTEGLRTRQMTEFSKSGKKESYWEEKKSVSESKTHSHSFRRAQVIDTRFDKESLSPRNLIRSFSAPVTGTAFGKLLLEDQHVLTGAHIRRKHEASEQNSPDARKNKKDSFSLKGKVSNLKQNLSLKGKLFGKKTQLVDKSDASEFEPLKHIITGPSVVMNLGFVQARQLY
ncbi:NAD(P)-binding domain-containing protein [Dioscorea alata]|uniref:NAD(P)-binding domain-containing protein n=1 Tax=Dioscorea alata TaxID=55571 RepID=A0ACB7UUH6_DIOAL|nr:NAD(P)-binding domain-containing protein [Dioscorea alata]